MTDLRKAAELVCEVWFRQGGINYVDFKPYMEVLRQALAQRERSERLKQKPVAWYYRDQNQIWQLTPVEPIGFENKPLYTAPPKREWVGLTDAEYDELMLSGDWGGSLIQATQVKLKEKNT